MKKCLPLLMIPVLVGCLSSKPLTVVRWNVTALPDQIVKQSAKYGAVRLAQVSVRAPYDTPEIALVREDGSVTFDAYNRFATTPSALLKGASFDILRASELFKEVLGMSSSARASLSAEIDVSQLALETVEGALRATVSLQLMLIDQKDRTVTAFACGTAVADASSGRYTDAFAQAYTLALDKALKAL